MHTYPYKIENGEGEGEVITFLGVVRDRDGDRMEVEVLAPPNVGTPMHLHHLQEKYACSKFQRSCKKWRFQFFWPLGHFSGSTKNSRTHQSRSWQESVIHFNTFGFAHFNRTIGQVSPNGPFPVAGRSTSRSWLSFAAIARPSAV